MSQFQIIQGGMGVGVSCWQLARAVSKAGQLGVVSGTGIGTLLARRLQMGDPEGHMRRALAMFPDQAMAEWAIDQYFVEGGKADDAPFKSTALPQYPLPKSLRDLTVMGAFAEVWLAKEGHSGVVGINLLEKIQILALPTLLGAILAGADYVLMGAGIPRLIPGAIEAMAAGRVAELKLDVEDAEGTDYLMQINPADYGVKGPMRRPKFFAIVASNVLAMTLARKSNGTVDGFVVEGPTAGGHNAPPRGHTGLSDEGEPIYGERDVVDLEKMKALQLPFYLAGGFGVEGKLHQALAAGAAGIQVGTAFAFCNESGIDPAYKREVLRLGRAGKVKVFTDPLASPTGFPFKVVELDGTVWGRGDESQRTRICDVGSLRKLRREPDGSLSYRCPAEPTDLYVAKGGDPTEIPGRKCLCNALFATIGLGQLRADGRREPAVVTAGDDVVNVWRFLPAGREEYAASDVIRRLLGETGAEKASPATCGTVRQAASNARPL